MKKAVLAILVFSLLVALCACGGKDTTPVETTQPTTMAPETTAPTTGPSEEPTEPSEEPTEPSEEPTEPSEEPTEPSEEPTTEPPHTHAYTETVTKKATCSAAGEKKFTCACGDSYTKAIDKVAHNYADATCTTPKTCKTCKSTSGKALGHSYKGKTCSRCGATDSNYHELTEGTWTNIDTDCGHQFTFYSDGNWYASVYYVVITYEKYESLGSNKDDSTESDDEYSDPFADPQYPYDIITVGGTKYAYGWPMVGQMEDTYTTDGDTVTIKLYDWCTLVLERTAGNILTVRSIDIKQAEMGIEYVAVGDEFIWCPD